MAEVTMTLKGEPIPADLVARDTQGRMHRITGVVLDAAGGRSAMVVMSLNGAWVRGGTLADAVRAALPEGWALVREPDAELAPPAAVVVQAVDIQDEPAAVDA